MFLRAKFVAPLDRAPIENGQVEIRDGKIAAVGGRTGSSGKPYRDLGDVVLMPGLVNAHTHLELSLLHGQADPALGFVPWIERIGSLILAADGRPEQFADAARIGATRSLQAGVTLLCDITRRPDMTRPVLSRGPLRVVSCGEVVATGNIRHLADRRIAAAIDRTWESMSLSVGISPHSPYLCEPSVWPSCMEAAQRHGLITTIHAAESREEVRYLARQDSPIRDFFQRMNLDDGAVQPVGPSAIQFLARVGALTPRCLLAHVNYIDNDDIQLLAASGAAAVYCPRTHAAFGHDRHPLLRLLQAGIPVCLGTDSLASNPSLSVLDEARLVFREFPGLGAKRILEMVTCVPGRLLGPCPGYATLSPGTVADLTAVSLDAAGAADPLENILHSSLQPDSIWIDGKVVVEPAGTT